MQRESDPTILNTLKKKYQDNCKEVEDFLTKLEGIKKNGTPMAVAQGGGGSG